MSGLQSTVRVVRRWAWLLVLIGVVVLVGWLRFWRPVAARTVAVERGSIVHEAFGRGTIESEREAAVGFDLVGRLSEVLVDEGARVTLGQGLARLETNQAEADLRTAQNGISAARASLARLAAEEERARALVAASERDERRTRALVASGAITIQEADEATDRHRLARADLDRVLAQRAEATRGIDIASSGAAQRQVAVVRATLLAPFDGVVTRRLREPGDTVTIGTTILRIADTTHVFVRAAIDETALPSLAEDQRSEVTFVGGGTPLPGKVRRIAWEADRQTHEISVEVTLDELDRRVAIGQRADVRIELVRRDHALRVPLAWIHHDDDGPYVFVDRAGRIAVVRPTFGLGGREHVEVLAGLAEGDTLLAAPSSSGTLPAGRRWKAE